MATFTNINQTFAGPYLEEHILEKEGISKVELARRLGVSRQTIYDILNGSRPISAEMALKLSEEFGNTPYFWKNLNSPASNLPDNRKTEQAAQLVDDWKKEGHKTLVDHEILIAQRLGIINLSPFDEKHAQPVSYDIGIGNAIINGSDIEDDLKQKPATLKPGASAFIQSLEKIHLPPFIFCRLGCMTGTITKGVEVIYGLHIDPGYSGWIYSMMKNLGNREVTLQRGERFLSVEFNFLPVTPNTVYMGENQNRKDFSKTEKETIFRSGPKAKIYEALDILAKFVAQNE